MLILYPANHLELTILSITLTEYLKQSIHKEESFTLAHGFRSCSAWSLWAYGSTIYYSRNMWYRPVHFMMSGKETQCPTSPGLHFQRFDHLPVAPQAGDSTFNTWPFRGTFKIKTALTNLMSFVWSP